MRTLNDVISTVRDGGTVEYEELRYAVIAMDALTTLDRQAFMKLAAAERENKPRSGVNSVQFQWEEHFGRHKRAGERDPKSYVGWNNDPDNPEFLKRRVLAKKVINKVHKDTADG